jgi:hypothetical protein
MEMFKSRPNHNLHYLQNNRQAGRHSICNSNHVIVNHLIIFALRIEYGNHLIIRVLLRLALLITLLMYTNFALQCKVKVTNGFIAICVLITLPGHLNSSSYSVGFVMLDIIFCVECNRSLFGQHYIVKQRLKIPRCNQKLYV